MLLVFVLIAILVLTAAFGGLAVFFLLRSREPEPSALRNRLSEMQQQGSLERAIALNPHSQHMSKLLKGSKYKSQSLGKLLERYSFVGHMQKILTQAGMTIPVDRFILLFLLGPFLLGLALLVVSHQAFFLALMVGGPAMFYMGARMRQQDRLKKFMTQMPDALNLMTSSLRAGHSFQSAIKVVATELSEPISTEFSQVVNDVQLGIPVRDALKRLVKHLDTLPDVRMFVTAVLIQREVGGNLAEVLDKLSNTIRERFKLRGQITALTAQSRLTGYVLGAAPAGLFVILFLFFNNYVRPLYTTDLGMKALVVALILQIIGFTVMKKIVEIRL